MILLHITRVRNLYSTLEYETTAKHTIACKHLGQEDGKPVSRREQTVRALTQEQQTETKQAPHAI